MHLSFPSFCTAMDAADVEVRVVVGEDGRLVVRLVDFHRLRSLDLAVQRSFDAAAVIACCSLAICPEAPLARRWPELVALAHATVEAPDVRVPGHGRPGRRS